jgi:hypothetical protein
MRCAVAAFALLTSVGCRSPEPLPPIAAPGAGVASLRSAVLPALAEHPTDAELARAIAHLGEACDDELPRPVARSPGDPSAVRALEWPVLLRAYVADAALDPAPRSREASSIARRCIASLSSSLTRGQPANLVVEGRTAWLLARSHAASPDDALLHALLARHEASPTALLPSYPGADGIGRMTFLADNIVSLAALVLHDPSPRVKRLVARFEETVRRAWIDPGTGLLRATLEGGDPTPRGSATLYALPWLTVVAPDLARAQWRAAQGALATDVNGLLAYREYPHGVDGHRTVDSGRLVNGAGEAATGLAVAASRAVGDETTHARLLGEARAVLAVAGVEVPALGWAVVLRGRTHALGVSAAPGAPSPP